MTSFAKDFADGARFLIIKLVRESIESNDSYWRG